MTYDLQMGDDGILRLVGVGEFTLEVAQAVMRDLEPFLEAATEDRPLLMLSDVRQAGKISSGARNMLADFGCDPRLGKNAVLGVGRYTRVMAGFNKASGRDNINFFDTEEEALAWLKQKS